MNCQSSCSGDNAKITVEDKGDGIGSRHWWQLLVLWEVIAGHCNQGGLREECAGEQPREAESPCWDSDSWGLARPPRCEGHPCQGCRVRSRRAECACAGTAAAEGRRAREAAQAAVPANHLLKGEMDGERTWGGAMRRIRRRRRRG